MKNLLVYLNPSKKFDKNNETMVKIQIDNILELGWKKEDVMLITNFPYERRGIKSIVVPTNYFWKEDPASTKSYTLASIFENNS